MFAFREPAATPLCAFIGRELGAAITVVVTASHNPRGDNGYKVYGPDAVQIVSPVDEHIARHIAAAPPANQVPRVDRLPTALGGEALEAYLAAISAALPASPSGRDLAIVHSALHGVGSKPMLRALSDGGFTDVHVVAAQAEPDGTFPTTPRR